MGFIKQVARIWQILIGVFIVGLLNQPLYGQIDLGVIGGIQSSNFNGVPPSNTSYNSQTTFAIGGMAEYRIAEYVYLSFRPMYQSKGTSISFDVPDQRDPVDSLGINLKYLSLPLIIKVYADNKKFYILSGVDFGVLLSAELEQFLGDPSTINIDDGIRPYDLTVHFGIGYQFSLEAGKMRSPYVPDHRNRFNKNLEKTNVQFIDKYVSHITCRHYKPGVNGKRCIYAWK